MRCRKDDFISFFFIFSSLTLRLAAAAVLGSGMVEEVLLAGSRGDDDDEEKKNIFFPVFSFLNALLPGHGFLVLSRCSRALSEVETACVSAHIDDSLPPHTWFNLNQFFGIA